MKKLLLSLCLFLSLSMCFSQGNVGIGTENPEPIAVLDIVSTDKGILIPRTTKLAIQSAAGTQDIPNGLLIFDTNDNKFYFWNVINYEWESLSGNSTFETKNGVVRNTGNHATEDFVFGSDELPQNGITDDTLFFFDRSKGALRAGHIQLSENWSPDSLGVNSFASGKNTLAKGDNSVAVGFDTKASNAQSIALGRKTIASGYISTAIGNETKASGYISTAMGFSTTASGDASTAMGFLTTASGDASTAIGSVTTALGKASFAMGENTVANTYVETVIGKHNTIVTGNENNWDPIDRLFIIGNGNSSMRSDAMIVHKNGNTEINGEVQLRDGWVDADGDTKITMDEGAQDSINFSLDGEENLILIKSPTGTFRMEMPNNNDNIAVGKSTLLNNTTGSSNIAMGENALMANSTGRNNIANGVNSLQNNVSGTFNVAIGTNSLNQNTSGSHNVAIGRSAGLLETGSDKLYIESTAGGAVNNQSTSLIYGEFDNDVLRLNAEVNINGDYILPKTAGSDGQVIINDGTSELKWGTASSTFETVNGVVRNTGDHTAEDFVFGSDELPQNGITDDTLFFFDRSKGALRAGHIQLSENWSPDSLGVNSFASGKNTHANGDQSTAFGKETNASGTNSIAMGYLTMASGYTSFAMGQLTIASGSQSTAIGNVTTALGKASFAMGENTVANTYVETVIGKHNTIVTGNENNWDPIDRLFTIGNGNSSIRSDAMIVHKNGNTEINGEVQLRDGWVDTDGDTKITMDEGVRDAINFNLDGQNNLKLIKTTGGMFHLEIVNNKGNIGIGEATLTNHNYTDSDGHNIAIGDLTLHNNLEGSKNIALGRQSLFKNEDGNNNVAIGEEALKNNVDGSANVAIGLSALESNTTGGYNVVLGNNAAPKLNGGSNIILGSGAALNSLTGNSNLIIGNDAGFNAQGDNNIFLGKKAGFNETGSDKLYIANSDADATGALIYGDFATNDLRFNANVGLGRIAINHKLEVNGNAGKTTPGEWLGNSDARLKKNIIDISSEQALNNLLKLQGVTYEWNDTKTGNARPEGIQYGFTAQNIADVFPSLVSEDALGYLQTAYGTYDAMTVEAIRALYDKNLKQEEKITEQEARIAKLEAEKKEQGVRMAKMEASIQSILSSSTSIVEKE